MSEDLQAEIDRLKRKHRRDRRDSHGRGLMQGILSMLQPGDLVIDCGANLGEIAGPLAETGAHVHAFEPDPYNFAKLSERLGQLPNVTLHQSAVGTSAGTVRLMRAANWGDNPDLASVKSTIITGGRNISDAAGIDVALIDFPAFLQALIAQHGSISFLKM
ncbi:MAG: FkbM family methyltransferase, partial [Cypionkella sp.]